MLARIRQILSLLYFSLPVQLLIVQVRYHKIVIAAWLFLFFSVTKVLGTALGIPYLYLEPEYLGEVSFPSLFLLGCGFGAFVAAYNISTYIQDGYRFHFLVFERNPFFIFFLNNSLLPFTFVILYSIEFIRFQTYIYEGFSFYILFNLLGFILGMVLIILATLLYFTKTNKNIIQLFGEKFVDEELQGGRVIIEKAKIGMSLKTRVDIFAKTPFVWLAPNPSLPPDFRGMVKMLNQHHSNALFIQLIFLVIFLSMGVLEARPLFQIPAGMSILILFSILLMVLSALTFWFRKLGPFLLLLLALALFVVDRVDLFDYRHRALGMNYDSPPALYNPKHIYEVASEENFRSDTSSMRIILDKWKARNSEGDSSGTPPKMVLLCVSGGGLRSAFFTFRCLQKLDSLTQGELIDRTRMITGASGGMIGAAYFRELHILQHEGKIKNLNADEFAKRISGDLLNRITYKLVTSVMYPGGKVTLGGRRYPSDRGWSFDDQLVHNLGVFQNRRLGDYKYLEEAGEIPMIVLSPVVIEDGRKLFISASPAGWMARSFDDMDSPQRGVSGIDFRRFFSEQDPDSLWFPTALRMNASFPMITPFISLPTEPLVRVIDAGIADNLGLQNAARFLFVFREWLKKNTSGVLLVQIRDSESRSKRMPSRKRMSLIDNSLNPLGEAYKSIGYSKDISSEEYLNFAKNWLGDKIEFSILEYAASDTAGLRASLSWHLTKKETEKLDAALSTESNNREFMRVKAWLKKD